MIEKKGLTEVLQKRLLDALGVPEGAFRDQELRQHVKNSPRLLEVRGHLGGDGLDVDVVEEALVRVDQ